MSVEWYRAIFPNGRPERALTVGESFYLGTAWVLASYTDQRGVTTLVRIPFEVQRPHVALSLNSRSGGDASWHVLPNSHTSFYFEWIGKSSVLAAYGGDPAEDIDAFASYLGARPVGTVTTIWNRYERDLGASGLEDGTPYSVIIIPVSSSNGLTHTGMFSRLDF